MKKILILTMAIVFALSSCTSVAESGIPRGARPIYITDVMAEGGFILPAVAIIAAVDSDIDANVVRNMLNSINEDEDLIVYWVPSGNGMISDLSLQVGRLNGSLVFSKWSLKYASTTLKRMARSGVAAEATEEMMESDDLALTDAELAALEAKKDSFTDEQKKELKTSLIYLTTASASLVNVPVVTAKVVKTVASLIANPAQLVANPFAVPKLVAQAKSINDNAVNIKNDAPDVAKNLTATIKIVQKILE